VTSVANPQNVPLPRRGSMFVAASTPLAPHSVGVQCFRAPRQGQSAYGSSNTANVSRTREINTPAPIRTNAHLKTSASPSANGDLLKAVGARNQSSSTGTRFATWSVIHLLWLSFPRSRDDDTSPRNIGYCVRTCPQISHQLHARATSLQLKCCRLCPLSSAW
jgi:hypothetical protein